MLALNPKVPSGHGPGTEDSCPSPGYMFYLHGQQPPPRFEEGGGGGTTSM